MAAGRRDRGPGLRPRRRARRTSEALDGVELIDADEVIGNDEEPVRAVRSRPGASIVLRRRRRRRGSLRCARQPGLDRRDDDRRAVRAEADPGRPASRARGPASGARPRAAAADARRRAPTSRPAPRTCVQFAHLGAAFAEAVLGVSEPRVALLSVGEEAKKGTAARRRGARGARRPSSGRCDFARQRRGSRPARPGRRRDRHRRLHRQRRPEDDRGHRPRRRRCRPLGRPLGPARGRRRAPPATGARLPARCASIRTGPAARSCSGSAGSRSSGTAPRDRGESPTRSGWPRARSPSAPSSAPAELLERSGAGRGAIRGARESGLAGAES